MQLEGTWTGVLFIDKLRQFIEDEFFQIEILPIRTDRVIVATIKEQVQPEGLAPSRVKETISYRATGKLDAESGKIRFMYEAKSSHSNKEPQPVELIATVDEESGTMKGHYRLLSQANPQASFILRKTEKELL
jgi:hypothetical protein